MGWKERYASKIMSAEQAVSNIRPGENVIPGDFCAEPVHLIQALADYAPQAGGRIKVSHGGNVGPEPHIESGMEQYIDFQCFCAVPKSRKALDECRAEYTPCFFYRWPEMMVEGGPQQCDVALLQVSTPDEDGNVSLGLSSDFTSLIPDIARLVIVQVNQQVPWVESNVISLDKADCIVEFDEPLVELLDSVAGEKEKAIAKYVLPLIEDGACLQIGRGKLPDYVLGELFDRKHLGVHSEMISDGVKKLMEAGVVDNSLKQIDKGKTVCSMVAGSAELYRWIDHNPDVVLKPVNYTNDPRTIALNDNVVSLNSGIEVDLLGQVVCDMIGSRQFTGIGGFADFVRGAQMSRGGKSIIAFSATSSDGKTSRVVPFTTYGAAVASTRWDTNYVVTEYGVAQLWGKTNRERVEELINIAAPNFREELRREAIERKLLW